MSVVIGIDVGGSTTKIVGFRGLDGKVEMIAPQLVKANDPITATYGAFGKFTDENNLRIEEIKKVMMTGVGSSYVKKDLYGLNCERVEEFQAIGSGGLYLSGLSEALVVSMGTGTAMVHAVRGGNMNYIGGTGVGGGTLMGLSKLLAGAESIDHITELAQLGDLANVDLRIKDITAGSLGDLMSDMTAANFGNVSDIATKHDMALGIMNMVFETVCMVSVFASRSVGVKDIVLTGNVTQFDFCKQKFDEFNNMKEHYKSNFIIPQYSTFSTVIGTAMRGLDRIPGGRGLI